VANQLVASLLLKLEDQLGGGLTKLTTQLDRLKDVAAKVQLTGLKDATKITEQLAKQIGKASGELYLLQQRAREVGPAFAAMERIARHSLNAIWEGTASTRARISDFGEKMGVVGGVAGAATLAKPIEDYAERDKLLRSIGIMEHKSGPELDQEIRRLNSLVDRDALRNGLSSESVADAYKDLLGQGLPANMIDSIIGAHSSAAKAYGIPPDLLGPVTGALVGNLKIAPNESDTGAALAAIASASQGGRFKMADFAHVLPGLTGVSASLGMTGRSSLNELAAALEISTKTAVDPTQAGVNFQDLLGYITSNREDNLSRKKLGLDMPALLRKASASGTNPLDAYVAEIKKLTDGKAPLVQAQIISAVVTNQQARLALLALIQHNAEFEQLRKSLGGIADEKLRLDNVSAQAGAQNDLDRLNETMKQLSITLGQGFMPVARVLGTALGWINSELAWANENYPQTTAWVLGLVGGFIALAAVLGVVSFVWPAVAAGFSLLASLVVGLLSPIGMLATGIRFLVFLIASLTGISAGVVTAIGAVAAVLAFAAIDIYENWARFAGFFAAMWQGLVDIGRGVGDFFLDIFVGDMGSAVADLEQAWGGVKTFFGGLWDTVKQVFIDFGNWVDNWTGGLLTKLENLISKLNFVHSHADDGQVPHTAGGAIAAGASARMGIGLGASSGAALAAALAGAPGASGTVTVKLETDPGTRAKVTSASPGIKVDAVERGATVTRP
jgi:TP901 family phage tail tape measure protein